MLRRLAPHEVGSDNEERAECNGEPPQPAAALTHDWAVRFADAASAPDPVRRAAEELGPDLQILP